MNYPEHEKLQKIQPYSQKIGEFIDWLNTQDMIIAKWSVEDTLMPARFAIPDILARFFLIDQNKLEEERQHMLANLTGDTETSDAPK